MYKRILTLANFRKALGFSRTVIRRVVGRCRSEWVDFRQNTATRSVPAGDAIQHGRGAALPQAGVDSLYEGGGEMRHFGMPQSSQAGQKYTRCQRV